VSGDASLFRTCGIDLAGPYVRTTIETDLPATTAHINAIGTAVPGHDIHAAFVDWAGARLSDPRERLLFDRMVTRAAIAHRWSVLPPTAGGGSPVAEHGFYAREPLPGTAARMALYAEAAPALALDAVAALGPLGEITHLVVASCTGFVAPGIDQIIARRLGLPGDVERTLVGFMGCYAAVAALRVAHHIVRSEPSARVLVITVELSTLHLQPARALEPLLAMLQFADGAAAAIVTAEESGLGMHRFFAATLPDSEALIRWNIGDEGFAMHLSGEVPGRITQALADPHMRRAMLGDADAVVDGWAVHAGGRSILDAVEHGLGLDGQALAASRHVLAANGNMSSATLMFVLAGMIDLPCANGIAVAFGPGLAAEGFGFARAG
jgi:alpha-pyrone synthase